MSDEDGSQEWWVNGRRCERPSAKAGNHFLASSLDANHS